MRIIPQEALDAREACKNGQMPLEQLVELCDQLYEEGDAELLQFVLSVGAEAAFLSGDKESAYALLTREEETLLGLDDALADLWLNLHNQFVLLLLTGGAGAINDADALERKMKNILQATDSQPFMDYCPLKQVVSRITAEEKYLRDIEGYRERKAREEALGKIEERLSRLESSYALSRDDGLIEEYAGCYRQALELGSPGRSASELCQLYYVVARRYEESGGEGAVAENCEYVLEFADQKAVPVPDHVKWAALQLVGIYNDKPVQLSRLLNRYYDYLIRIGFQRGNLDEALALTASIVGAAE